MKKFIHKVLKDFGYKLSNVSKKEKEVQNLVQSFGVANIYIKKYIRNGEFLHQLYETGKKRDQYRYH